MARRDKLNQVSVQENQQAATDETESTENKTLDAALTEEQTGSTEEQTGSTEEQTGATEEQDSNEGAAEEQNQDLSEETKDTEITQEVIIDPPYVSFFKQYLEFLMKYNVSSSNEELVSGSKALNNCIKSMLKAGTNDAFDAVFNLFKEYERTITLKNKLQGIANLSKQDRAIVEVVTTIYHIILTDTKKSLDLEKARPVIKNNDFINWCAKKIG